MDKDSGKQAGIDKDISRRADIDGEKYRDTTHYTR